MSPKQPPRQHLMGHPWGATGLPGAWHCPDPHVSGCSRSEQAGIWAGAGAGIVFGLDGVWVGFKFAFGLGLGSDLSLGLNLGWIQIWVWV